MHSGQTALTKGGQSVRSIGEIGGQKTLQLALPTRTVSLSIGGDGPGWGLAEKSRRREGTSDRKGIPAPLPSLWSCSMASTATLHYGPLGSTGRCPRSPLTHPVQASHHVLVSYVHTECCRHIYYFEGTAAYGTLNRQYCKSSPSLSAENTHRT